MLALKIKDNEVLHIGHDICIILRAKSDRKSFKIVIDAPKSIPISRGVEPHAAPEKDELLGKQKGE